MRKVLIIPYILNNKGLLSSVYLIKNDDNLYNIINFELTLNYFNEKIKNIVDDLDSLDLIRECDECKVFIVNYKNFKSDISGELIDYKTLTYNNIEMQSKDILNSLYLKTLDIASSIV